MLNKLIALGLVLGLLVGLGASMTGNETLHTIARESAPLGKLQSRRSGDSWENRRKDSGILLGDAYSSYHHRHGRYDHWIKIHARYYCTGRRPCQRSAIAVHHGFPGRPCSAKSFRSSGQRGIAAAYRFHGHSGGGDGHIGH